MTTSSSRVCFDCQTCRFVDDTIAIVCPRVHTRSLLTLFAVTERARRLRAQYNVQAQHLRSRVEMRINRIPTALRKTTMGELLSKSVAPHQPKPTKPAFTARPPPVPAKDGTSPKPIARKPVPKSTAASRGVKRLRYLLYFYCFFFSPSAFKGKAC